MVAVFLNNALLESDTFNIRRREDRIRLGKQSHSNMGELAGISYPMDVLQYDLQVACLRTPELWEEQSVSVETFLETDIAVPVSFVLKPFVIQGGGTIMFAPPGAGKSYLLQAWAVCMSRGIGTLWGCDGERDVLYINLERSNSLMRNREAALRIALGWTGPTRVKYLDGRGLSLRAVERKAKAVLKAAVNPVVCLDSISRAGAGSLNDDEAANNVVNMLNSISPTWAAIGHTTKAEGNKAEHTFGSIHFVAGCDVEVKVVSEKIVGGLGVGLSITKANDIGHFPAQYLALKFDGPDMPIRDIRDANEAEKVTIALNSGASKSAESQIYQMVHERQPVDATTIAHETDINRGTVSDYLNGNPGIFYKHEGARGRGARVMFSLAQVQGLGVE